MIRGIFAKLGAISARAVRFLKNPLLGHTYFSETYSEARRRFEDAALRAGAQLAAYQVNADSQEQLFVDVAVLEGDPHSTLVVSSGVHGIEGYLGSAAQLAWLECVRERNAHHNIGCVLIHAVNPFGFSRLRRSNEDNVDLNRNFLAGDQDYAGVPSGYTELNDFLNPKSPPSRFEPFRLKAIWHILRTGLPALKQAVAGGQYEYPDGLFFGGKQACQSTRIIQENFRSWVGLSKNIVHIDFHSGLGKSAEYRLLLLETPDSNLLPWYADAYGSDFVEPLRPAAAGYTATGVLGSWIRSQLVDRNHRFAVAEFGTYGVIRVLAALRAENRAHFFCPPDSPVLHQAKVELLECFCPRLPSWRDQVIASAIRILKQSINALNH